MNPLGNNTPKAAPAVNPALQNLADLLRFAKSFNSPAAFLQHIQRTNPEMTNRLMQVSQTVKNPSAMAQQLMAQQGITPEQIQSILGQI